VISSPLSARCAKVALPIKTPALLPLQEPHGDAFPRPLAGLHDKFARALIRGVRKSATKRRLLTAGVVSQALRQCRTSRPRRLRLLNRQFSGCWTLPVGQNETD